MNNLPVLIVGAGPTGLMMACVLARFGVNFRIIDKKPTPTSSSNATWIQTRTLELLDQMGIADKFLAAGHSCDAINLYADGKQLSALSLKNIDSIYPFILMLPQSKTEDLLEKHLKKSNHNIERATEIVDLQYDDALVTATLKQADGHTEIVQCDWLIGCDGANSLVREKCGFHFPGEDLKEQFIVADATIDFSYMPKDEVHFFFDPGTVLAAFPLGKNRYRLAANLHVDHLRQNFYEREVIELVQERAHGNYYVTDVAWISLFWIHGKIAEHMRKGRIFLAGDAAHIHSPAGGQGMNTGLQDAYNLAWKLALVIKEKAKLSLLDSYQIERYPVVKEAVDQNEYVTKLALFDEDFIPKLQKFSHELAEGNHNLETKIANEITLLNIRYKDSPIIDYQQTSALLKPGSRIPDVNFDQTTLYRYFSNTQHNILLFTGLNPTEETLKIINDLQKALANYCPDLIRSYIVCNDNTINPAHTIVDTHWLLHETYQIKKAAVCIIRPDTYIAYYAEDLSVEAIEKCLRQYLY